MKRSTSKSNLDKLREKAEYLMSISSLSSYAFTHSLLNDTELSNNNSESKILKLIHEIEVNQIELEMQNFQQVETGCYVQETLTELRKMKFQSVLYRSYY